MPRLSKARTHSSLHARETRCSRIKHMSEHTCAVQSNNPSLILHTQGGGNQHPARFLLHIQLFPLICLSRCQWLVADVTTCCDQAAHQVITRGLPGHSVIRHLAQTWNVGPQRDQTHTKTSHGSSFLLKLDFYGLS